MPRSVGSLAGLFAVALLAWLPPILCQTPALATDRIALPPILAEHPSPSGEFVFVVSGDDRWKSSQATGTLLRNASNRREILWSRDLPQHFGPRYVRVNDRGSVLMLDEWINVKSPFAVLLIDRTGRKVARHDTDAVRAVLSVTPAETVRKAKHGVWITAPPVLSGDGETATVEAGGRTLAIGLADGRMRPVR